MTRLTQVSVDGFDLNTVEESGLEFKFLTIDGWHDGAETNVVQTDRIASHGQFPQSGHRGSKLIVINGRVEGQRSLVADASDRLNGILADGGFGEFLFNDQDQGIRTAQVQLLGGPDILWPGGTWLSYQLQLLSADPYRYGSTTERFTGFGSLPVGAGLVFPLFPVPSTLDFGPQGSVGVVTLNNPGTAPATIRFAITGPTPAAGFAIVDTTTGMAITFRGVVPTGSVLVMDSSDGSVVIDGVADRLGDTVVTAWPVIPPGESRDFLFSPIGDATAAVLTASATATYW